MWGFDDIPPPGPYRNQNLSTLKQMQVAELDTKLTSSLLPWNRHPCSQTGAHLSFSAHCVQQIRKRFAETLRY